MHAEVLGLNLSMVNIEMVKDELLKILRTKEIGIPCPTVKNMEANISIEVKKLPEPEAWRKRVPISPLHQKNPMPKSF
ncbi:hypothetical protein AMTRI_Chr11g156900 [Amborella trichopoda]